MILGKEEWYILVMCRLIRVGVMVGEGRYARCVVLGVMCVVL